MTKMVVQKQQQQQQQRPMSAGSRPSSKEQQQHQYNGLQGLMESPTSPPAIVSGQRSFAVSPVNLSLRSRGNMMPKKMLMGSRDKEALLEEIRELKRVLYEQSEHIKFQKVHTASLEIENRKLEKDIEDLEAQGIVEARRTGGSSRLRAKLQGLKMRINDLETTCEGQHDELSCLRKDIRVSHTREVEVERDVFAGEVGNLQKLVRRLNATHNRISCQNKDLGHLKEKAQLLEVTHHRLESSMRAAQDTVERVSEELRMYRNKARDTTSEANKNLKRCNEIQEHSNYLETLLDKENGDKDYLERKLFNMKQELNRVETQLAVAKGYNRQYAFKGDIINNNKKKKKNNATSPTTTTTTTTSHTTTPKSPKSPPPHNHHHHDVINVTNHLVNMASFHFEQKHKGE